MTITLFLSMLSFCFVLSISPGPVNTMIVTSGVNYGFKKTFSFISGATIGFTLLLVVVSLSYEVFLSSNQGFLSILELVGSLFIIYMGYKIATSKSFDLNSSENKTLRFYEGFLLQWLNPKAWLACVAGVSMYATTQFTSIIFVIMYFIVCYLCLSFWGVLGEKTTKFLNTKRKLKVFNIFMGTVLIFSALSILVNKVI